MSQISGKMSKTSEKKLQKVTNYKHGQKIFEKSFSFHMK